MKPKILHQLAKYADPRTLCREGCGFGGDCCLDRTHKHTWHVCNDEKCRCHECEPVEGINPRSFITRSP